MNSRRPDYKQIDPEWLRRVYTDEMLPLSQIAELAGVSYAVVGYARQRYGIPARRRRGTKYDVERLRALYWDQGLSLNEIGSLYGVNGNSISQVLEAYGIPRRPSGTTYYQAKPWHDPEWLRQRYWDDGLSQAEIAEVAGCTPLTIHKAMKKSGVPARQGRQPAPVPETPAPLIGPLAFNKALRRARQRSEDRQGVAAWLADIL